MKKAVSFLFVLVSTLVLSPARAATITQNFTANPLLNGWRIFGDTSLFRWDATNHDLAVTWDSSQSNSYYYLPLSNILGRDDDFQFSFDITISNLEAGVNTNKPDALEVGVGFLNYTDATSTNFVRGIDPTNVSEFDYFPYFVDPMYGPINPSISQVMISTNGDFYGAFGYFITFTNDVSYHVQTSYSASTGELVVNVTVTGQTNVLITAATAPSVPEDDDFRVDTFSISSYTDTGDPYDSLYGQGTISNLSITLPPPPIQNLTLAQSNGLWQAEFTSRTNWYYTLLRTTNVSLPAAAWRTASITAAGNATNLILQDTNAPTTQAFYRVSAIRP
jgi:hypothetical protein